MPLLNFSSFSGIEMLKTLCIFMVISAKWLNAEHGHDHDEITVWSFRNNNLNNVDVKAYYKGAEFTEPVGDFSICFRYKVLYFKSPSSWN